MATGSPLVNGDVSRGVAGGVHPSPEEGTLEDTLKQMNILIQENRELKEALRTTNLSMKERFEDLSIWKERQREERNFLEGKLEEARRYIEALTTNDQELRISGVEEGGAQKRQGGSANQIAELEALRAHVVRLQAEKCDLVAMNSELQLKAGQGSPEDSFIEIRIASDGEMGAKDVCDGQKTSRYDMSASRLESEDLTVSQLLQSLRKETQRVERLQIELQGCRARITELEEKESSDSSMQTSLQLGEIKVVPPTPAGASGTETEQKVQQEDSGKEKAASEVENLNGQMMTLFKELQQAQSKLDEAEGMKKNLQDRCRDVEQEVGTLKAQLVEKQMVQCENDRLKLQLDSMQQQIQLEQRKTGDDRNALAKMKDAYTKLFEDYNELKEERKNRELVAPKELVEDLQTRLVTAEQALAAKQQQIDVMKQEIYQKEKELETISVFQAQAEVYSSDFYAERAAREKIHEERERLATQLEFVKKQNTQLQEEMDSLGRMSLNEMQRRHVSRGNNPHGGAGAQGARGGDGRDWQQQVNIPEHVCPKCNETCPDLDSLQIHIMDCII